MSRTMIISSWPTSNTASTTASGSSWSPAKTSRYISATRRGVSFRPSRPRSSPIPSRIRRTPSSTFWTSNSLPEGVTLPLRLGHAAPGHGDAGAALVAVLGHGALLGAGQDADQVLLLDGLPLDQRRGDLVE